MKILVIEDEYNLADIIATRLREEYKVDIITDGIEGLNQAISNMYDLIILDVMLPRLNGFEILKELKINKIDSKVIMLTAKNTIEDKLNGLLSGAVDYMTKPFHIEELVARVNIQLKHNNIITYKDLELDTNLSKLKCIKTNQTVELVCKELQLLEYFFNNPNQILSKEQIYNKIWGIENEIESNNLEAYLSFIRRKLNAIGTEVNIKSVRGLGYKIENEKVKK